MAQHGCGGSWRGQRGLVSAAFCLKGSAGFLSLGDDSLLLGDVREVQRQILVADCR